MCVHMRAFVCTLRLHVCASVCVPRCLCMCVSMHACVTECVPVCERGVAGFPGELEVLPVGSVAVYGCHPIRLLGRQQFPQCFLLQVVSTISDKKQPRVFAEAPMICYHLNVSAGGNASRLIAGSETGPYRKPILLDRNQPQGRAEMCPSSFNLPWTIPLCGVQDRPRRLLA